MIPSSWILLNDQSVICCFKDKECLQNVCKADRSVTIHCNAGKTTTNLIGELRGFPEPVWCDPKGIANIPSLDGVEEHFNVSHQDKTFHVHKPDGTTRQFICTTNGLRHWDTKLNAPTITNNSPDSAGKQECALVVNTAAGNKTKFSLANCERAEVAQKAQEINGQSLKDCLTTMDNNLIMNCPVTRDDIEVAESVFGPSTLCVQGKQTRRPSPIHCQDVAVIPPQIHERHKHVHLCIDVFFVNKIPFLITPSEGVRFMSTECLPNRQQDTIFKALMRVRQIHNLQQFKTAQVTADSEFKALQPDLADNQIGLTTVADDKHIPQIKRCIRTIEEQMHMAISGLPHWIMPTCMLIEILLGCITWLNFLPPANDISATISPRAPVTGVKVDFR